MRNLAPITAEFTPLTAASASNTMEWTSECDSLFREFLSLLCSNVLFFPCQKDEFIVETDASPSGVGSVLSVRRLDRLLPVAVYSRRTTRPESRYSAQE